MTDGKSSPFEVPADLRRFAEQSVEQAKQAFDGFMSSAQKAASTWERQASTAQAGARDIGQKAMSFAEQNVQTTFEFAQQVLKAKDPQEVLRLQSEFVTAQMRALAEQAKELGQTTAKATMEATKPKS
jgi:phasin